MGFFEPSIIRGSEGANPHHNYVVMALMVLKFGTGIKLDILYTMVAKTFLTSVLLRNYDITTFILADP